MTAIRITRLRARSLLSVVYLLVYLFRNTEYCVENIRQDIRPDIARDNVSRDGETLISTMDLYMIYSFILEEIIFIFMLEETNF